MTAKAEDKPEKKKQGRPKKSAYIKKVEEDVKSIYSMLGDVGRQLKEINETLTGEKQPEAEISTSSNIKSESTRDETKSNYPVPEDYRKAVDLILNQEFGVIVEPCSDTPEFNFVIVVPQKYSSFDLEESKMKRADLRSKNVSYAEKTNGVKAWAEKVFSSFNAEVRAQIVNDRRLA